jgi:rubrerythrin
MTYRVIYGPGFSRDSTDIFYLKPRELVMPIKRTWQCTVCGLKHEGDSPPNTCAKCGVNSSKFIKIK